MSVAVLIDYEHAKIFRFKPTGMETEVLKPKHPGSHDEAEFAQFCHGVAGKIEGATELLILGPGVAKSKFKHHLESHQHEKLNNAVVGVEAIDSHETEPQILARARKAFKSAHLFS